MFKVFETERLSCRPIQVTDNRFMFRLLNSSGWLKFIGDREIRSDYDAEKYIYQILQNNKVYYHVFELKETQQAVGVISFIYRELYNYPDIGFAMLPEFYKKGYALEATKKYLEELADDGHVSEVYAFIQPDNLNSTQLIKRLGFKYKHQIQEKTEVLNMYSRILYEFSL